MAKEKDLLPYDYIVVATKNVADVPPSVADMISPAVTQGHTVILLLQNGLNIERPVSRAFRFNVVLSGITVIGARESPAGTIHHSNYDISFIGPFANQFAVAHADDPVDAAAQYVDMYDACPHVDCRLDEDVAFSRWKKLLYNASFNSVAALLRTDTSRMRASEHVIDDLVRPVMREIVAVAEARGVELPLALVDRIVTVDLYESFFRPSMCQDVERGNLLEFENIVGEPLREAEALGLFTPTLKVLYALLRGLQYQLKEAKGLVEVPARSTPELKYGDKNEKW